MQQISKMNLSKCEESVKSAEDDKNNKVIAKIPQGYDTRINIRLVPGREFGLEPAVLRCKPRHGKSVHDAKVHGLDDNLIAKLKEADKKVVAWLSADDSNAQLFLSKPVEALVKAGVELARSEQKSLNRSHTTVNEARVIAPGVNIKKISVATFPKGQIGNLREQPENKNGTNEDFGCEPKRKE